MKLTAAIAILLTAVGCSPRPAPQTDSKGEPATPVPAERTEPIANETAQASPDGEPDAEPQSAKDAMTLYRAAQALMKDGKLDEGYKAGQQAMQQFIAEENDLAWMMLESISAGDKRIDVHLNMGERERQFPDNGIVRPLSFRIWSTGDDSELLQIIDFEIGRVQGVSATAALGETTASGHANYGILDVDASYQTIRESILKLVAPE